MIPIKINNIPCNLPTSWDDVTLRQYLDYYQLGETNSIPDILAAVTGVSPSIWANVDYQSVNDLIMYRDGKKWKSHLDWMKEKQNFERLEIPKWLTIKEMSYRVPDELSEATFAQHISVTNIINSEGDCTLRFADILAIFFYPIINDCEYDEDEALEMAPMFYDCKWVDVCPIANFFFQQASGYGNPLPQLVRTLTPKKWRRTLVNLMNSV